MLPRRRAGRASIGMERVGSCSRWVRSGGVGDADDDIDGYDGDVDGS